jgi:hypothetical protein
MKNSIPTEEKIRTFADVGSESLGQYVFVAPQLNQQKAKKLAPRLLAAGVGAEAAEDEEKPVQFRMNQTGNIFYATTSPELQEKSKALFDSVTVLFAAMTKALADKGKDLFDYPAWSAVIGRSGYFVEVQKFEKRLNIDSGSLTIDTQIVQQLLPGLKAGSSMEIAKGVLGALNGKFSAETTTETTKIGHLLFICEELFGAPSVTVRLFFASKTSHTTITSSPCHKSASQKLEQLQQANTFLFVDPDTIANFAGKFARSNEEYKKLVEQLSGYIQ